MIKLSEDYNAKVVKEEGKTQEEVRSRKMRVMMPPGTPSGHLFLRNF